MRPAVNNIRVIQGSFIPQVRGAVSHARTILRYPHQNSFPVPSHLAASFGSGHGRPLPDGVRSKMESFFRANFADVRVHVGGEASSVGALAFTYGDDIYFAPGRYNPATAEGQRLLGHELTHVVQQRSGRVRNPFGDGVAVVQDPVLETEATLMGSRAAGHVGTAAQIAPAAGSVQRVAAPQWRMPTRPLIRPSVVVRSRAASGFIRTPPPAAHAAGRIARGAVQGCLLRGGTVQLSGEYRQSGSQKRSHIDDLAAIEYSQAAWYFESELGRLAADHPTALAVAKRLVEKARDLAVGIQGDLTGFGSDSPSATGSVGTGLDQLKRVVESGNFRERMTFVYNGFCNGTLKKLIVAAMEKSGQFQQGTGNAWAASLFQRDPEVVRDRPERRIAQDPSAKTTLLSPEQVTTPPLSEGEKSFVVKENKLQWQPGTRLIDYRLDSTFQKEAYQKQVLVGGGRSGTTYSMLQVARVLGEKDFVAVRLACLGWMLPAEDHTFYEIMTSAKLFDPSLAYTEGPMGYRNVAPLTQTDLAKCTIDGKFPDYFLSEDYKDELARSF
jgi:Domain of unknown function (DUF4157)